MKRVTGIGGIFWEARDPVALRAWYQRHLGIDVQAWGGASFPTVDAGGRVTSPATLWSIAGLEAGTGPEALPGFTINYRVDDLASLVQALRDEGCQVLDRVEVSEYGSFAWVIDPEGHKVELWQPPAGS